MQRSGRVLWDDVIRRKSKWFEQFKAGNFHPGKTSNSFRPSVYDNDRIKNVNLERCFLRTSNCIYLFSFFRIILCCIIYVNFNLEREMKRSTLIESMRKGSFSNKISNIFEFTLVQEYFYITISNFSFKESIFYWFVTNANKEQRVFRTMEKDYRSIFFPFKISLIKSKSYYLVITHPDIYIIERNFQFNVKKE